jgi:hypothetical protein
MKKFFNVKIWVLITFIVMVLVNTLANTLPINGQTTGAISDYYKNLFAPTGITFAIWGLIYFAIGCYTIYQTKIFQKNKNQEPNQMLHKIGKLFIISSLANAIWIFTWHYNLIVLSVVFMIIILICLIYINKELLKEKLSKADKIFIKIPFSIYFGWITVATIANITAMLVGLGIPGVGEVQVIVTSLVIIIGLIISSLVIIKDKNYIYGLVIIWAYFGIYLKHVSTYGFNNQYPLITYTTIASICILALEEIYISILNLKNKKIEN